MFIDRFGLVLSQELVKKRQLEAVQLYTIAKHLESLRQSVLSGPRAMFVTLWLSLVTAAPTIASDTSSFDYLMSNKFDATRVQSLHLFSAPDNLFFDNGFAPQTSTQDFHEQSELFEAHYSDAARITAERILTKMWVKTSSDPVTMATDIQELAAYIAQQPHAYELLTSLEKQPLRMRYRANDFSTQVRGDHFSVRSVTIHFDPNSAAVLGVSDHCRLDVSHCVASPADAFLHELLHAYHIHPFQYPKEYDRELINKYKINLQGNDTLNLFEAYVEFIAILINSFIYDYTFKTTNALQKELLQQTHTVKQLRMYKPYSESTNVFSYVFLKAHLIKNKDQLLSKVKDDHYNINDIDLIVPKNRMSLKNTKKKSFSSRITLNIMDIFKTYLKLAQP